MALLRTPFNAYTESHDDGFAPDYDTLLQDAFDSDSCELAGWPPFKTANECVGTDSVHSLQLPASNLVPEEPYPSVSDPASLYFAGGWLDSNQLPLFENLACLQGSEDWNARSYPMERTVSEVTTAASSVIGDNESIPYRCTVCKETFRSSESLEQHAKAKLHRIYVCRRPGCEKCYYRRDLYTRHKATHDKPDAHACQICAQTSHRKVFKRKDHLHQHIKNCHQGHSSVCPSPVQNSESVRQERSSAQVTVSGRAIHDVAQHSRQSQDNGRCIDTSNNQSSQSLAMRDVVRALKDQYGEAHLGVLHRLQLHEGSTTQQLAESLAKPALAEPARDVTSDHTSTAFES